MQDKITHEFSMWLTESEQDAAPYVLPYTRQNYVFDQLVFEQYRYTPGEQLARITAWLQAAYLAGAKSGVTETVGCVRDYAVALAGLEPVHDTLDSVYERLADSLDMQFCEFTEQKTNWPI